MIIRHVGYRRAVAVARPNGYIRSAFSDGLTRSSKDPVEVRDRRSETLALNLPIVRLVKVVCPQCNTEYIIMYPKQGQVDEGVGWKRSTTIAF